MPGDGIPVKIRLMAKGNAQPAAKKAAIRTAGGKKAATKKKPAVSKRQAVEAAMKAAGKSPLPRKSIKKTTVKAPGGKKLSPGRPKKQLKTARAGPYR